MKKEESHAVQEEGQEIDRLQSEEEGDEEEEIAKTDDKEPGRNLDCGPALYYSVVAAKTVAKTVFVNPASISVETRPLRFYPLSRARY